MSKVTRLWRPARRQRHGLSGAVALRCQETAGLTSAAGNAPDAASTRSAARMERVQVPTLREVSVRVTVNGVPHACTVPARTLLVHLLRDRLRLTGTHVGCDTTQCGACTVDLDGAAVKSCTVLAAQADGHEVTTIEGITGEHGVGEHGAGHDGGDPADAALDPVQRAFKDEHALQ